MRMLNDNYALKLFCEAFLLFLNYVNFRFRVRAPSGVPIRFRVVGWDLFNIMLVYEPTIVK